MWRFRRPEALHYDGAMAHTDLDGGDHFIINLQTCPDEVDQIVLTCALA